MDAAHRDQHRVWESISDSFDRTRPRPWPVVAAFVASLGAADAVASRGLPVLDLMAGNARHATLVQAAGHAVVAADWSRPAMGKVHAQLGVEAVVADAVDLPFADRSFGAALWIAGLHGIPSPAGRDRALHELCRVLAPGARALVTVWSRDAPRFAAAGPAGEPADVVVPWRADGLDERRRYHLYTAASLRAALEQAGLAVDALDAVAAFPGRAAAQAPAHDALQAAVQAAPQGAVQATVPDGAGVAVVPDNLAAIVHRPF